MADHFYLIQKGLLVLVLLRFDTALCNDQLVICNYDVNFLQSHSAVSCTGNFTSWDRMTCRDLSEQSLTQSADPAKCPDHCVCCRI